VEGRRDGAGAGVLIPAAEPAARNRRLLHLDPRSGARHDLHVGDLPGLLRAGDLVVVNDAATLPASFAGRTADGTELEVRLAGANEDATWTAVLLGAGDWHQRTEDRPPPPALDVGAHIAFGPGLAARVAGVSALSPRLVTLAFTSAGSTLWSAFYRLGRPVQYSYLRGALALWDVQPFFASRPWAYEPASAGLALSAQVMDAVRGAGAAVASVTHAAGLSSTGDPAIDAALPLRERYDVPEATVRAIEDARRAGGRVLAIGTTVVRALEGAAANGEGLTGGEGWTSIRIGRGFRPRVVDALFTGLHQRGESHFELLRAFAADASLEAALDHADRAGYLTHEFGDAMVVI
jgi:S-adenosylmethionine:tRNA ribosyltransferase-isomerase